MLITQRAGVIPIQAHWAAAAAKADLLLDLLLAHCGTTTAGRLRQWPYRQLRYGHPPKLGSPNDAGFYQTMLISDKLFGFAFWDAGFATGVWR
jgi:hypothetical protein